MGLAPKVWKEIASRLASYGHNLLRRLIAIPADLQLSWLVKFSLEARAVRSRRPDRVEPYVFPGFADEKWQHSPGMSQLLLPRLYIGPDERPDYDERGRSTHHQTDVDGYKDGFYEFEGYTLQHDIFRQRAWIFLDDARLYPSDWASHFPAPGELATLERKTIRDAGCISVSQLRLCKRSRAWNERGVPMKQVITEGNEGRAAEGATALCHL